MADWTNITDSSVDPDAPVTSELAYAFRDNPVAITEAAAGAPRISRLALKSSTTSVAGSITSESSAIISLGAFSFFPDISAGRDLEVRAAMPVSGGPDDARFVLKNSGIGSLSYSIKWRRLDA